MNKCIVLQIKKEIKESRVRITSKVTTVSPLPISTYCDQPKLSSSIIFIFLINQTKFFYYWCKKWQESTSSLFWLFIWLFQLIMKVVDIINNSQDEVRSTVLVSASAIGYYGSCPSQFLLVLSFIKSLNNMYTSILLLI